MKPIMKVLLMRLRRVMHESDEESEQASDDDIDR